MQMQKKQLKWFIKSVIDDLFELDSKASVWGPLDLLFFFVKFDIDKFDRFHDSFSLCDPAIS